MKSKGIAYLLWFFLGGLGIHKFYLEKVGMGVLYILTGAVFGIGWLVDLFTLGSQVDTFNRLRFGGGYGSNQAQNIVVNVNTPAYNPTQQPASNVSVSLEKQIFQLANERPVLRVRDVITNTQVESFDKAEEALEAMVTRNEARKIVDENGVIKYDFS